MSEFTYNAATGSSPAYRASGDTSWKSLGLAGFVHLALIAFLWIGVQWQSKSTDYEEVEVWDLTSRQAAPLPVVEEPIEEVKEVEPPKVIEKEVEKEDPEIALELERKRLAAEKKRIADEELERKKEKEKLAAEKLKKEKQEKEDEKKKLAKEKAARDKMFEEDMKRLNSQASKTGSGGVGDAVKSTGNNRGDPSYLAKIGAKVKSNTAFSVTDTSSNNPTVEFIINLFPDGSLRGPVKKTKSSGNLAFDDAVEKAIEKSVPFPRDKTGDVPASLVYVHKMKE
ncbi:TonB C-terminal domain-containing protein [Undibacterium sp. LX40W]|uniref:TonB C-terminal domain-containing protein n=1 Tax=Undibacterium nitidum TaxID=2762298 RepID=A0A923KQ60_9BURK|nr:MULTISPECIES: energy transducer TonB [Undibacterium]MBC3882558.1 TonB C-terminal domain-containing protein [Undibacterium nitidum]MBC3892839.1 TonB C-terminal domain-containing protein [Undibacterium sp. LX40W]